MYQIKNLLLFAIIYIVFSNEDLIYDCSAITDITKCYSSSNFCYVVESNAPYLSQVNKIEGVVQNELNDVCRNLNFFTICEQLYQENQCKNGNCLWDPIDEKCYNWNKAPCQIYPTSICQWNQKCELINETQTLELSQNYTLMNNVDAIQNDGRKLGTWLYEYGLIIEVLITEQNREQYKFTKCEYKQICENIKIINQNRADYECSSNVDCYFDIKENKCKKINRLTECNQIKQQSNCNGGMAPCMWIDKQCKQFNQIPCNALNKITCLNNENCYLQNEKCNSYTSCSDNKEKNSCDESNFFCYFDEFEKLCKQFTKKIQCKKFGEKNCKYFQYCKYNQVSKVCDEKFNDFYCQNFLQEDCQKNNLPELNCIWNDYLQICDWNYQKIIVCELLGKRECDNNYCFYDDQLEQCSYIQSNTNCELLGRIACTSQEIQEQNLCQWSSSRNLCSSIFNFSCEELNEQFCKKFEQCYFDNVCKTRQKCKDNLSIQDCQDDLKQSCYFDYDLKICRRVTTSTSCNLIFKEHACNSAICSWFHNKCQSLEDVYCQYISINNCKYQSNCQLQNKLCLPIDICELNNQNKKACDLDPNHCFYNPSTQKCLKIDGTSDCSLLNGVANCNYGHCALVSQNNEKIQCINYEYAECSLLNQEHCNFGQCAWLFNQCVNYPNQTKEQSNNHTIKPNSNNNNNNNNNYNNNNNNNNNNNFSNLSSYYLLNLLSILAFILE